MKTHKKILASIVVAVVILHLSMAASALECRINGIIPDISITSHAAGDKEYADEEAYFSCDGVSGEWDECRTQPDCPWNKYLDDVDIPWTATAGSFKDNDNEGSGVFWIAPSAAQSVTLTATAEDDAKWANDTDKSDQVTIDVIECDDSVNYEVGERCETCEWIEADQFFPYCGTPKYVKLDFDDFTPCGGNMTDPNELILIQTSPTTWHVTLNNYTFATWMVNYYDYNDTGTYTSAVTLYLGLSCPAFTDYDMPVCYDGMDPTTGPFTNNLYGDCGTLHAGPCGTNGTATVTWGPDINETAYCAQDVNDPICN